MRVVSYNLLCGVAQHGGEALGGDGGSGTVIWVTTELGAVPNLWEEPKGAV